MEEKNVAKGGIEQYNVQLSVREKLCYGSGNFSYSIFFIIIMTFLNTYWTDVVMIPMSAVAVFLVVSKIWDAVNDPIVGFLEDNSGNGFRNWGRYRTWAWCWVPLLIFLVLEFSVPNFASQAAKNAWAFIMYFIFIWFYTSYEMSHVSLMSAMTADYKTRGSLASYRMTFSNVSGILVSAVFMTLVVKLGAGSDNPAAGWSRAVLVLAVISVPFFLTCFFGTKERIRPTGKTAKEDHVPLGIALKTVVTTKPALVLAIAHLCWGMNGAILGITRLYYFIYVYGSIETFSTVMTVWMVGMALGSWISNYLMPLFKSKRTLGMIGWIIGGGILIVMNFIPGIYNNYFAFMALWFLYGALGCVGLTGIFGSVPDVVEYAQIHSGVRLGATLFAIVNFALKLGQAFGQGIFNGVLASAGYVPNQAQNEAVCNLLNLGVHLIPGIILVIGAIFLYMYKIDSTSHEEDIKKLG